MKETYVFGDVHGELTKLKNCIDNFNGLKFGDRLISLGDLVDRGPDSFGVVEYCLELSKKYEMIFIKGNHDDCFYKGLYTPHQLLFSQGAKETCMSYIRNLDIGDQVTPVDFKIEHLPVSHKEFFEKQLSYFVDEENNCYVHGGFNRHYDISDEVYNNEEILLWDRDLLGSARSYDSMKNNEYKFKIKNNFKEVFVGHTPVQYFDRIIPTKFANVWDLDCGSGKYVDGTVCLMNVKTKEFIQY